MGAGSRCRSLGAAAAAAGAQSVVHFVEPISLELDMLQRPDLLSALLH